MTQTSYLTWVLNVEHRISIVAFIEKCGWVSHRIAGYPIRSPKARRVYDCTTGGQGGRDVYYTFDFFATTPGFGLVLNTPSLNLNAAE